MAQYQVPQFINTESKIIGPFTLRQFIFIGSGGALILGLQYLVSYSVWLICALIIAIISAALAFVKIDNIPLPRYIAMSVAFLLSNKKYIYQNQQGDAIQDILKK